MLQIKENYKEIRKYILRRFIVENLISDTSVIQDTFIFPSTAIHLWKWELLVNLKRMFFLRLTLIFLFLFCSELCRRRLSTVQHSIALCESIILPNLDDYGLIFLFHLLFWTSRLAVHEGSMAPGAHAHDVDGVHVDGGEQVRKKLDLSSIT